MLKSKKIAAFALSFVLCLGLNLGTIASDSVNVSEPTLNLSEMGDIPIITEHDIVSGYEIQVSRDRRSYWKSVTMISIHEDPNPSFDDWPQTVYHTEPNPYGTGTATGYLDLASVTRVGSVGSVWKLTYKGYMYYYE